MVRVLIACVLLVAGCSATPPATTVSTYSPPPRYAPPPRYYDPGDWFVPMGTSPALQPPQRVIVMNQPSVGPAPTISVGSQPYQARPYQTAY